MTAHLRLPANTRGRDLIVGDVHGCFWKLVRALALAGFDTDRGDRLISVGDLVDRGPESPAVLTWLAEPWFYAVQGNHEDMACAYHRGQVPPGLLVQNGGAWLLGMTREERQPFVDAFEQLPIAITLETAAGAVGIVHADCPRPSWGAFITELEAGPGAAPPFPGMVVPGALREAALWSRARVECATVGWEPAPVHGIRAVVVGHTPADRVRVLGNVHYIDTFAWRDGEFTILDAATLRPAEPTPLAWS